MNQPPRFVYLTCGCNRQRKVTVGGLPVYCRRCGFVLSASRENSGWIKPSIYKAENTAIISG